MLPCRGDDDDDHSPKQKHIKSAEKRSNKHPWNERIRKIIFYIINEKQKEAQKSEKRQEMPRTLFVVVCGAAAESSLLSWEPAQDAQ